MFQTLIASANANAGAVASLSFTSIPQTYTDLAVVLSLRGSASGNFAEWQFNSSTTTFTGIVLRGDGSTAASLTRTNGGNISNSSTYTANTFANAVMFIPNYTGSAAKNYYVDAGTETNSTGAEMNVQTGSWNGTAAITSLSFNFYGGNLAQYSTAYLYGTLKGSGGASVS
jgi:hypothetical protein